MNISKNAFHSIPRQGFFNLWLETSYTENALYTVMWIPGAALSEDKMRVWVLGKLATTGS